MSSMAAFAATGSGLAPINTPSIGADFCRLIDFTSVIGCGQNRMNYPIRHLRMPAVSEIMIIIQYYDHNAMGRPREQTMRYEKGHKDATRQRIIDVASRQFREHGVAAVGLAVIMIDAGLTNGAFYAHFGSKEDLVREVLANADKRNEVWQAAAESGAGLAGAVRGYLSSKNRDNPGRGCPIS